MSHRNIGRPDLIGKLNSDPLWPASKPKPAHRIRHVSAHHEALLGIGPDTSLHLTEADSSASPAPPLHLAFASTENAKWWLAHLESLMAAPVQGCELPPPSNSLEFITAAWVRYLLATAITRNLSEDKTHWQRMKLLEAKWHAGFGHMPPEIPKRPTVIQPAKRCTAQPVTEAVAA